MEDINIPERMFAAGEEPSGERINTYHKPKRIESIMDALQPDEIEFMRNSTFGKIISQAENPSFSGAFGQFVIVRMLKVKKKFEIWFLFAGKPVRMSLAEFAFVTGLNCNKIVKKTSKRKKNPITEKLYWGELFGSLKFCPVETAIEMLKKNKVKDRQMRLKYACLAFTASVLLPTSHLPRIIPEHVELIRDLSAFLAYPWGRVTFEMLVTGIKKKDEISLSQSSVALPGFVDAIQMVFMAAVPKIKEVVPQSEPIVVIESDSESDSGCNEEDVEIAEDIATPTAQAKTVRYYVNPTHVRDLHEEAKTEVISMLEDTTHSRCQLEWDEEIDDAAVDKLVTLLKDRHPFQKSMFVGGLTGGELARLKAEKKQKEKETKEKKEREGQADAPETDSVDNCASSHIANLVAGLVNNKIVDVVSKEARKIEERLGQLIVDQRQKMEAAVIRSIVDFLGKPLTHIAPEEDTSGGGESSGVGDDADNYREPPAPPKENRTQSSGPETVLPEKEPSPIVVTDASKLTVDELINKVITDVGQPSDPNAMTATENSPMSSRHVGTDPQGVTSLEQAQDLEAEGNITMSLSQKQPHMLEQLPTVDEDESLDDSEEDVVANDISLTNIPGLVANDEIVETRKSKRTRTLPPIFNDYMCDPKIKAFRTEENISINDLNVDEIYLSMRERVVDNQCFTVANGASLRIEELDEIVHRNLQLPPKVMDVLTFYIAQDRSSKGTNTSKPEFAVYDTNFPASIMRQHARLTKTAVKDRGRIKYDEGILQYFKSDANSAAIYDRIYFPFCIDKEHWVGVCVDIPDSSVQILDCNHRMRTENQMKKEINPITVVVPHIINSVRGEPFNNATKPFVFSRVKDIPQHPNQPDSAVVTVLLMQAHAANDVEGCRQVTPSALPPSAKHLAVLVLRDIGPV